MSRNPSLSLCTLFILVAFILCVATRGLADERLPIPDEAAQKQAVALVQEVFGEEIANARTTNQRLTLTKKLLKEASNPNTSPAGQYALLQVSLKNASDAQAAMPIVDEMAKHFQIDGLKIKASTVWRMSNRARTSSQHKAVAVAALQLIDESVERDAYDPAITLAEIATRAAQKARNRKLLVEVRTKTSEVRKQKADFEKSQAAMTLLEQEPTNAEANLTVGLYQCLVKGDWDTGLPMLALGTDATLKNLATQELKAPTKSNEQVALADGWYDLAQTLKDVEQQRMLQRAGFWYQLSLTSEPDLLRLVRIKVEKRLRDIPEPLPSEVKSGVPTHSFKNSIGMQFKLIPAGSFMMGSPESDSNPRPDEKPQHRVTISRSFYMGITEVTGAQYEQVMGKNPNYFKLGNHPAEQVSWDNAVEFCKRLSALPAERSVGRVYRLPTEAEWEYACRAGTTTRCFFGDDASRVGEYAWNSQNSGRSTHPVGEKKPNPWGLYDMYGNVWEWCQDWLANYPRGVATDPQGPSSGTKRVYRGGSWNRGWQSCYSALRTGQPTKYVYLNVGFRVVSVSE